MRRSPRICVLTTRAEWWLTIQQGRSGRRDFVGGEPQGLVDMNVALRDATCRVAEEGSDRQFREDEIVGNAREGMAQRVWRHVR